MKSSQPQLLTFIVMLAASRAFGQDAAVRKNTLITTVENQIEVVCEGNQRFTGDLERRVYAQNFGRFIANAEVVQIHDTTGNTYLGYAHPLFVDLPEGVVGVSMAALNIRCDRGLSIPDDDLKKGSKAVWSAFETGLLSSKDDTDSQWLALPWGILDVFSDECLPRVNYSIRSITLKENRVTLEILNTKKTHVGLVVSDASKWPWAIVEASIDGHPIDLNEEREEQRAFLKAFNSGQRTFLRFAHLPSPSPADEEWMKGSSETAPGSPSPPRVHGD